MGDGVLLIPGFFGFGTFGAGGPAPIRYFDHVIAALEAERPDLRGRIHATEPPPTGSRVTRVEQLYRTVAAVFAHGIGPQHLPIERLHLIGHSTGGLCARLLTNRHRWTGDLRSGSYSDLMQYVGTVVTVAAPLHGTPLATRFAGEFELSLPGLSLLSIFAKAQESAPVPPRIVRNLLLAEVVRHRPTPTPTILELLLDFDPTTAGEIARFLDQIVQDHALINDLQPESMRALNTRIEGGDYAGLRHVVTVAPPPSPATIAGGIVGDIFRAIYATLYEATADPAFTPAAFPNGPWLHGSEAAPAGSESGANDGVVPSGSQTLAGTAHLIVEADHLDVIGHFQSRRFRGTTVFRSGAEFDDEDFQQLWSTIGGMLR
jgi:pimeloyl-ACP methyl ester carboxylesterase